MCEKNVVVNGGDMYPLIYNQNIDLVRKSYMFLKTHGYEEVLCK